MQIRKLRRKQFSNLPNNTLFGLPHSTCPGRLRQRLQVFYDLALEVPEDHICCILPVEQATTVSLDSLRSKLNSIFQWKTSHEFVATFKLTQWLVYTHGLSPYLSPILPICCNQALTLPLSVVQIAFNQWAVPAAGKLTPPAQMSALIFRVILHISWCLSSPSN